MKTWSDLLCGNYRKLYTSVPLVSLGFPSLGSDYNAEDLSSVLFRQSTKVLEILICDESLKQTYTKS